MKSIGTVKNKELVVDNRMIKEKNWWGRKMKRTEYISRINKVISYIDDHLAEDLSLASLPRIAAFSPFHFLRIFKAVVGENPIEYVKRVRVEKSAQYLIYRRDLSITEIAFLCGFSSSSIFSRAFSEHFKINARAFRNNNSNSNNCNRFNDALFR